MRTRRRLKKKVKRFLIVFVLVLISSLTISKTYARYTAEVVDDDEIRVAKYGSLTLVEKLNGEIQENNLETASILEYEFELGNNIDKEVYIEFINSEVSVYVFLTIESVNWNYDNSLKEFYIMNNNSKLLSFNLDSNWNYLENLSDENKFIFYIEFDVKNNPSTKLEVMNQINTGIIGIDDIELLQNTQLKFNAYSIQKNDDITIEETWNYVNIE